ncbi:helix-turn-helix domain-containing protein [Rhodococcus sp. IEGM 1379]|uniref:PucR family transcriptional regulator n=1 Tax=Rhodococcus sp. IEGM 1379 TaxID=3047086 RepID=UPI0024B742FE|nr:helix-turn-helix domain-containing protein [Rhodococcus sp. IEGM 1379]MDI9915962.1 helix-turn-helix domain-containing protein [Rhodococcus sp. IEGM 1379]
MNNRHVGNTTDSEHVEAERLSLGGLLEEPIFDRSRILAGSDHMDSAVTWCLPWDEVLSRPDSLAGVVVYTRPESLSGAELKLKSLLARGAGAVIVDGTAPASTVWPPSLPAVELAFPVGFTVLNKLLAERALTQEAHVMRYGVMVHQSLAALLHRGAGVPMLVREVSSLTSRPALALDVRGKLIYQSGLPDKEGEATSTLVMSLTASLPTTTEAEVFRSHEVHVIELPAVKPDSAPTMAIASAMHLAGRHEGWVVVLAVSDKPRRHDIAQYKVVVEQAGTIIGTEMLRQRSVDEAEERAKGDFVQALVHGNFANDLDLTTRADLHEIDLDLDYIVFVAPGLVDRTGSHPSASMVRLARYAAGVLPHRDVKSHVTVIGDFLIVVRSLRSENQSEIDEYANAMSADLEKRLGQRIPVAHGTRSHGVRHIDASYREARIALGIAARLDLSGSVSYRDLRGFGVLAVAADTSESRRLIDDILGPLRTPGGPPDFEKILFAYLAEAGNTNAAARKLGLHRNTMISKLDRISRSIGLDLKQAENQFTIWLALRLDLLSTVRAGVDQEMRPT